MQGAVVLIGMMGAGKTAVGTQLARMLGVPFHDSDREIEKAAAMSVSEIFARDGEAFFRQREAEVIERLLDAGPAVIAVGGGAWLQPANRALIARRATSVWLDVPLEVLWERVRGRSHRPLLATADPRATLERILAERLPGYARAAIRVPVGAEASVEATAGSVLAAIRAARPEILA